MDRGKGMERRRCPLLLPLRCTAGSSEWKLQAGQGQGVEQI